MDVAVCIICNESDSGDLYEIKEAAINHLIASSKQRCDNKFKIMNKLKSTHVHKQCQKHYNRQCSIDEHNRNRLQKISEGKKLVKDARTFDFASLCFLCGEISNKYKHEMHFVTNDSTRQNVIDAILHQDADVQSKNILARLSNVENLITVNARYHSICMAKFFKDAPSCSNRGRPPSQSTTSFIEFIVQYIKDNKSECQFSLKEIKTEFTDDPDYKFPDITTIKNKLNKEFSDEIIFNSKRDDLIILYKTNITKKLAADWYEKRLEHQEDEDVRIVEMAAEICLREIRSICYMNDKYEIPDLTKENLFRGVPKTLKTFLDIIVKTHKDKSETNQMKYDKKVATLSHCIIASARPRSFSSPILLGLSSMMHKKYASKGLIDSLSNLGLVAPYKEVLKFESSIIHDPANHTLTSNAYIQFVFDNADHNTNTIDGRNTFHAMGGIMIATPSSSVISKNTIAKLNKIPTSEVIGKFGFVDLKHFEKKDSIGLNSISIEDVYDQNRNQSYSSSMQDFTWFYSKFCNKFTDGWNGFMQKIHSDCSSAVSKIIPLPFVNNPPSSYDTIFTVLVLAAEHSKIHVCFVTFDQPLWFKAREILASVDPDNDPFNLSCIRVRLGGFHLLMSFLGAVGYIMDGSGLREAFSEIYAENSADKALTGHAYSRSIRGHFLVQLALTQIILTSTGFTDAEKARLDTLLLALKNKNHAHELKEKEYIDLKDKFMNHLKSFKNKGKTSQLWIQYWEMIAIIKDFIRAERSGNWDLHLKCVEKMLPYFHASGHFLYAKSAHLYLQDMRKIKDSLSEYEFDKFTIEGYFTIRRTHTFWSGVWSDMIIEQVLMRAMKTQGGLTHGRGMSDSVIAKFILTMIILIDVCNEMENFCNVSFATSEQHLDSKEYRIARDVADLQKISQFFDRYVPFPVTKNIMSIYSGVIGDESINCYKAREEGEKCLKSIIGGNFGNLKFKRKNKVLNIKVLQSSIKINDTKIVIDPLLLFQRISLNINCKDDMKEYMQYELAPFPLSLFTENGLRKNTKSELYREFTSLDALPTSSDILHVIDGGYLLHKVILQKNDTIAEIENKYCNYVRSHYAANSLIVFDGYPEANKTATVTALSSSSSGTKQVERSRRTKSAIIPTFEFQDISKIPFSQDNFLSNQTNKNNLIQTLSNKLLAEGFLCKQAPEDADALIIKNAIELAKHDNKTVVVVGQDIDLLVLLHQLNSSGLSIFFHKPGSGNEKDSFYTSNCFKHESHTNIIAFLHAFSGCDTTSGFAGKGKTTIVKSLLSNNNLSSLARIYFEKDADPMTVAKTGSQLIAGIYKSKNTSNDTSLNKLRFKHYQMATNKTNFKLEKLPPTEGAAAQHSYRVYYQIQIWLGNFNNVTDSTKAKQWGWSEKQGKLVPKFIPDGSELIPEKLLKVISCSCAKGCNTQRCGCRKHGLKCSNLCTRCQQNCLNTEKEIFETSSDAEEVIDEEFLTMSFPSKMKKLDDDSLLEGEDEGEEYEEEYEKGDDEEEEGEEEEEEEDHPQSKRSKKY